MMSPTKLAQYALLVLRQIDKLGPSERADVLLVANAIVAVECRRALQPAPVKDE